MRLRVLTVVAALAALTAPLWASAPAGAATACAKPAYSTSQTDGMWGNGRYIVANDMWNVSHYSVSQRLTACSYRNWDVSVSADDSAGDGAVKTYPNVHRDFINWGTNAQPSLRSFSKIRSTFASSTPSQGVYDAAYDIWLNRLDREVMIWTYNRGQRPAGSRVASNVRLSGHRWNVYATRGNSYIAFVPTTPLSAGTLNIKRMLHWGTAHRRIPASAKLAQICFGFEVVSSGGSPASFSVNDFSVTTARRR